MSTPQFLVDGVLFACAIWVMFACGKRINLMRFGLHDPVTVLAYILLGVWALSYVLHLEQVRQLGIVPVAILFWGGRQRWLSRAPTDTERAT
jgi:predicted membrane channel-forming protein YqfA (hemolysin III family)